MAGIKYIRENGQGYSISYSVPISNQEQVVSDLKPLTVLRWRIKIAHPPLYMKRSICNLEMYHICCETLTYYLPFKKRPWAMNFLVYLSQWGLDFLLSTNTTVKGKIRQGMLLSLTVRGERTRKGKKLPCEPSPKKRHERQVNLLERTLFKLLYV